MGLHGLIDSLKSNICCSGTFINLHKLHQAVCQEENIDSLMSLTKMHSAHTGTGEMHVDASSMWKEIQNVLSSI